MQLLGQAGVGLVPDEIWSRNAALDIHRGREPTGWSVATARPSTLMVTASPPSTHSRSSRVLFRSCSDATLAIATGVAHVIHVETAMGLPPERSVPTVPGPGSAAAMSR